VWVAVANDGCKVSVGASSCPTFPSIFPAATKTTSRSCQSTQPENTGVTSSPESDPPGVCCECGLFWRLIRRRSRHLPCPIIPKGAVQWREQAA
jgi:hypothetical protein